MADSDIVIVNQPLKRRESKSGKVRFTIEIQSEPLIFNLDPKTMEASFATAIADELRARVQGITQDAPEATLTARKVEAKAYADGKPWALKRFAGGKLGAMPPNQTTRAFNNSGRFAKSIVAMAKLGKWTVNVAANRLDPTTGNVDRIWARLVSLVPAFVQPALLNSAPKVAKSVKTDRKAHV